MCIYCKTDDYRKIYENHSGSIPKGYEIHHIDGNHSNNIPSNLMAVTAEEHYYIHESRGDWAACLLIKSQRLNSTYKERSELARKANIQRLNDGVHIFQNAEFRELATKTVNNLVALGKHNLQGSTVNLEKLKNGEHPSQNKVSCIHCRKVTGLGPYHRYHGDNCEDQPENFNDLEWVNKHKERKFKKEHMRKALTKAVSKNYRAIIVDGVKYKVITEVMKKYNLSNGGVRTRIRSNSDRFKGWKYAD